MHTLMYRLSQTLAVVGGLVLSALIILTFLSVLGRQINGWLHGDFVQGLAPGLAEFLLATGVGPVNGDFELVEAGVAFAIFCFLPLCQITAGHASVDIFTTRLSEATNRVLRMLAELVFAGVLVMIAVQLYSGTLSKMRGCETFFARTCETTFLLQFPVWWAFGLSAIAAAVAAVVGVYMACVRVAEVVRGRPLLPDDEGAAH